MSLILIARHGKTKNEHLLVDEYKLKVENFIDLFQNEIHPAITNNSVCICYLLMMLLAQRKPHN